MSTQEKAIRLSGPGKSSSKPNSCVKTDASVPSVGSWQQGWGAAELKHGGRREDWSRTRREMGTGVG